MQGSDGEVEPPLAQDLDNEDKVEMQLLAEKHARWQAREVPFFLHLVCENTYLFDCKTTEGWIFCQFLILISFCVPPTFELMLLLLLDSILKCSVSLARDDRHEWCPSRTEICWSFSSQLKKRSWNLRLHVVAHGTAYEITTFFFCALTYNLESCVLH